MCETKLRGEPFGQLLFDLFVRDGVPMIDVINPFLHGCNKPNSIRNLINGNIGRKFLYCL